MAAGLYDHVEVFTTVMDTAFQILGQQGAVVRADWLSGDSPALFDDVTRAQPLLYAVDYALGRVLLSWGVEPAGLLGHSVGEMVAATLAGVFDFASGMRLMQDRIEVFADTPPGGMLAVAASTAELESYLQEFQVAVAAVNAPRQMLLAGEQDAIVAVEKELRAADFVCKKVRARQAFHSPVVSDAAEESAPAWRATALAPPGRTVYSAYLGTILSPEAATDPEFWARQPVDPVLFGPTLDMLLGDGGFLLVEAGPGQGLSALARRHPAVTSGRSDVVAMLPGRAGAPQEDRRYLQAAAERIAAEGHVLAGV